MTRRFTDLDDLRLEIGNEIGVSSWFTVSQEVVTKFAQLTGDHEWLHVDIERAKAGPFGSTIAHGYLTLSLIPRFAAEVLRIELDTATLNYGLDTVRFPRPVLTGSRVRGRISVTGVDPHAAGTAIRLRYVVEIDGEAKPGCIADTVLLVLAT